MLRTHLRSILVGACLAALAACSGDRPTATAPDASLQSKSTSTGLLLVSGGGQSGSPATPLPEPVIVRVLDQRGAPVPNANLNFLASAGVAFPRQTRTDADGYAQTVWTLGPSAGEQTLRVSGTGGTLTLSANALISSKLQKVSGDSQTATAGTLLPAPLMVRAVTRDGRPAAGVTVLWTAGGGGSLSPLLARTGADGIASARWMLGAEGAQTARATTLGAMGLISVEFRATLAAKVARVQVAPDPLALLTGRTGVLVATAYDAQNRMITGRQVAWTSSAPAIASVAAGGVVTGVAAGSARVTATVDGVAGSAAVQVTAPVPGIASVRVTPATVSVAVGGTAVLAAVVTDSAGRTVTGKRVTWASAAPGIARVDTAGRVTGVAAGSARVSATVEGKVGYADVTVTAPASGTGPIIGGIQINTTNPARPRDRFIVQIFAVQDPDGVMAVSVTARSPDGRQTATCNMLPSQSYAVQFPGPPHMPWNCYMQLPENAQHGRWTLDPVAARDSKGNVTTLTGAVLVATRQLNTVTFEVENLAYDKVPPAINGMSLKVTPYSNAYNHGWEFEARMPASDVGAGVAGGGMEIRSPGGALSRIFTCIPETFGSAVLVCRMRVLSTEAAGEIVVYSASVSDKAENWRSYSTAQLESAGYQARIAIP
ncbi:Ig-like domain-containing protein [Longimicrobium terrae]|uniref:BIG2 domain-containing protein n=1 Tax=Longimicrobium terrae TaxID=1639882 RepID=A0A841H5Y8_9BACT|nr:Ig-like domain-containing protein [Longimicrobium terrae]MBB4638920.1 hypothetical protein [Longimicrobium terrae]MBB6073159.1 hypothetical protein [Longimicrobium terrae]NNC30155.1 hypothetical protein [Longimicrobium terrae]